MDSHAGYNQIFIVKADVHKTTFWCPGALGTYECVVMPFGLKNVSAMYQRAMNTIFHDLIVSLKYTLTMLWSSPSVVEHI